MNPLRLPFKRVLITFGFFLTPLVTAELLVYEGFSLVHYPVGSDMENRIALSEGVMYWDAYKVPEPQAFVHSQEGSLTYEANGQRLVASGGHILSRQTLRAYAVLGDLSAGQVQTYSEGTYYLSFLMQLTDPLTGYRGFELANGTRADSDLIFRVHNFSVEGRDGQWVLDLEVPHNEVAGLGPVTAEVFLFVVRFDLGADTDTVAVWVNPSDLSAEAGNDPVYSGTANNLAFDRLAFSDFASQDTPEEGNIRWDEVRLATTWEAALPFIEEIQVLPPAQVVARATDGGLSLRFSSATGLQYQLQQSATLEPGSWVDTGDTVPGNGGILELSAVLPSDGGLFYRIGVSAE